MDERLYAFKYKEIRDSGYGIITDLYEKDSEGNRKRDLNKLYLRDLFSNRVNNTNLMKSIFKIDDLDNVEDNVTFQKDGEVSNIFDVNTKPYEKLYDLGTNRKDIEKKVLKEEAEKRELSFGSDNLSVTISKIITKDDYLNYLNNCKGTIFQNNILYRDSLRYSKIDGVYITKEDALQKINTFRKDVETMLDKALKGE